MQLKLIHFKQDTLENKEGGGLYHFGDEHNLQYVDEKPYGQFIYDHHLCPTIPQQEQQS